MNAYLDALRRYTDFSGRSTRSQFWLYGLISTLLLGACAVLDVLLGFSKEGALPIAGLFNVAHLIPSIAVMVRRLHDIDKSGPWALIAFVPIVGQVVLIVFACMPSSPGANRFGPPVGPPPTPKGDPAAPQGPYGRQGGHQGQPIAEWRPAQPTPVAVGSPIDQLERLAKLREAGSIDDNEYQHLKARLLSNEAIQ